jgi:NAD(P)-dependent dehydrogenase (short-subunit alcohol dehydrogenase family)
MMISLGSCCWNDFELWEKFRKSPPVECNISHIRVPMTNLANKTVLITGAGGGFGRHMVQQFRAAGSKLIVTDVSDDALRVAIEVGDGDIKASVVADLATADGCNAVLALCGSGNCTPDILVNNAGIAVAGRLDHVPQERWESLMQLNLLAPMRLCSQLIPPMVERGSGHIVNVSSLAGWIGSQGLSSYCAAKFGLRGFGESLAYDLRGTGVQVTNVYPCFSRTPILDSPQYGYSERRKVPEYLISEPADVVAQVLDAVRGNKLHVFPDRYARTIHYVARFVPWLLPMIERRLDTQSKVTKGRVS